MTVQASIVTVSDTPTALHTPTPDAIAGASIGVKVPSGGATVFLGGPDVTATGATQGWPVAAGESFFMDVNTGDRGLSGGPTEDVLYAVVATSTQDANVIVSGV
jgi:hypothetical protein